MVVPDMHLLVALLYLHYSPDFISFAQDTAFTF